MPIIQINTAFNIDLEFEIAEFHKRLFAYCIDYFLMIMYLFIMKSFMYSVLRLDFETNIGLDILIISLPLLFYSLITEVLLNGQTLGKKIMSIRVISLQGGEPTFGQFILRWITKFFEWPFLFGYIYLSPVSLILYIISTAFLGVFVVIIISVTNKNQRLGDIAAGTVIVNTKSDLSVNDTIFMDINKNNYSVTFPDVMRLSDRDINTIKNVVTLANKSGNYEMCNRVSMKIKDVLKISTEMIPYQFLEKLLEDYNFLATNE